MYQFWRFVFVQREVAKYAQTFLEFPPAQKGASFNLQRLKEELEKKMQSRSGRPVAAPMAATTGRSRARMSSP